MKLCRAEQAGRPDPLSPYVALPGTAGVLAAAAQQLCVGRPMPLRAKAASLLINATAQSKPGSCQLPPLAGGPLAGLLQMVRGNGSASASAEQLDIGHRAAMLLGNMAIALQPAARAALVQAGAATALLQPLLGPAAAAGSATARLLLESASMAICSLCQGGLSSTSSALGLSSTTCLPLRARH